MKKKGLLVTLGCVCIFASFIMYTIGGNSGHLTELRDTFWIPLPLGAISLVVALMGKKQ